MFAVALLDTLIELGEPLQQAARRVARGVHQIGKSLEIRPVRRPGLSTGVSSDDSAGRLVDIGLG